MGITKTAHFSDGQNELANVAKALGHPARIAILEYLLKADGCICGDIVGELQLAQATVSQHLKALKDAGIIRGTISGTSVCYCIDDQAWANARTQLNALFDQMEPKYDCC